MPEKPVIGGTWKGAMITAVHLHADPLCPDETEGVILAWLPREDECVVWTVDMDGDFSAVRYSGDVEGALSVYTRLVMSMLYGFANVPVLAEWS